MIAELNTQRMLSWWADGGVQHADLAVRRPTGVMVWHHDQPLDALPLRWARAENAAGADVYIRPARGRSTGLVFLDDVGLDLARRVANKYSAMAVQTSRRGGCHVWLTTTYALGEAERARAQRWLVVRLEADPASTSGEHLGRLAGLRNWKRDGEWVNVAAASRDRPAWDPAVVLQQSASADRPPERHGRRSPEGRDQSPSGMDWAWVCALLEAPTDPRDVQRMLEQRALARRGTDAVRYAERTVRRAVLHLGNRTAPHAPPPQWDTARDQGRT